MSAPVLHIRIPSRGMLSWPLAGDSTVIGRDTVCDIALPDQVHLSRRHLRISRRVDDAFFAEDLQSTNGTLFGCRTIDLHELADGDVLHLGELQLQFRRSGQPSTLPPVDADHRLVTTDEVPVPVWTTVVVRPRIAAFLRPQPLLTPSGRRILLWLTGLSLPLLGYLLTRMITRHP